MSYYTYILEKYDVSNCKTFEDVKNKFPDRSPAYLRKIIHLKGLMLTKDGRLVGTSKKIVRGQRDQTRQRRLTNHLMPPPADLFNLIKMKTWKLAFPVAWVMKALQSERSVLLFLDENDSDFNSYLVEILKTNQHFLSYYANYVHLKRRQKTFAQALLSLLFLESKNIQTGKSFAEDVTTVITKALRLINRIDRRMHTRTASLFRVFIALLSGNQKRRAASIRFLKCMKCYTGRLKWFELSRDLRDQEETAKFFSDILNWFFLSGELETEGHQRKFIACIGNIYHPKEMQFKYLLDSGLPELFEQILPEVPEQNVKFCLVSAGKIPEEYVESGTYEVWTEDIPNEVIKIVRVPFVSEVTDIEKLVLSVIKELIASEPNLGSLISNLLSEDILSELSNILLKQNNGNVCVIDIANDLSTLLGAAIQKSPSALTLDELHMLFDVAHRPTSTKETSIGTTSESRTPKVTRHPKIKIMKKTQPSPSSLLPPISMIFERCEKQLKKSLNLPQDVLDRTQELIEECRPYMDKHIRKYQHKALDLDIPILDLLPRYLQPEMMIGACLYLSCKENGIDISQFKIAKTQGHYDTSTLNRIVREIRTNLHTHKMYPQELRKQGDFSKKKKMGRYPKVNCPQCGKEIFLVYPNDPFCSTKCRREYKKMHPEALRKKRGSFKAQKQGRYPKVNCPQCGKEIFLVYPNDPFCSTKCRREYKKTRA